MSTWPPNLYKCDFTLAVITVDVFNGHLSIVLNPALTTQDVMNAGCYFVPFIVVPKPVNTKEIFHSLTFNLTQMVKVNN